MKKLAILSLLLLCAQAPVRQHWAEVDASGVVLRVIVADQRFINSGAVGDPARWIRTYKDRSQRRNYAAPGYTYDTGRNAFIPPKPFPSWTLDEVTARWVPPVPVPQDGILYNWDEGSQTWRRAPLQGSGVVTRDRP